MLLQAPPALPCVRHSQALLAWRVGVGLRWILKTMPRNQSTEAPRSARHVAPRRTLQANKAGTVAALRTRQWPHLAWPQPPVPTAAAAAAAAGGQGREAPPSLRVTVPAPSASPQRVPRPAEAGRRGWGSERHRWGLRPTCSQLRRPHAGTYDGWGAIAKVGRRVCRLSCDPWRGAARRGAAAAPPPHVGSCFQCNHTSQRPRRHTISSTSSLTSPAPLDQLELLLGARPWAPRREALHPLAAAWQPAAGGVAGG